mmetsp:Transcript_19307/g.22215  ORF Transcript_19307/g.22215 Transcript_19307/m.22215 type:complete len:202 (+) Transcript_19307:141-746(+)
MPKQNDIPRTGSNLSSSVSGSVSSMKKSASSAMGKAAKKVGIKKDEPDLVDEISEFCPKLTYQQRVIGFAICFSIGYLITFLSFQFFTDLVLGDPLPFVLVYSGGNILSIMSASFLCGPKRQFKNMFHKKRKVTTIVYLSSLLVTLVVAFLPGIEENLRLLLLVVLLIVQVFSSLWYSLSYIPFARKAVSKCFKNTFGEIV